MCIPPSFLLSGTEGLFVTPPNTHATSDGGEGGGIEQSLLKQDRDAGLTKHAKYMFNVTVTETCRVFRIRVKELVPLLRFKVNGLYDILS
jgi:hypothetical protein